MKTKKQTAPDAEIGLNFEQAIARLEKLVAEMESSELSLEDVLKRYEEGSRLVRFCGRKLEEAERKIELLSRKNDGSTEVTPFEPEPETETDSGKLL
jgi:exodeoxyribonuclease VII small subunit